MPIEMNNGTIAFLDILGFKGIWQRREPDEVLDILNSSVEYIKDIFSNYPFQSEWGEVTGPDITILSDTIVIIFGGPRSSCSLFLAMVVNELIAFFLDKNLFLRGAIGYGNYIKSGNSFLGPAIDDVAAWYEASKFIGVIATPRTSYLIELLTSNEVRFDTKKYPLFIKHPISFKNMPTQNIYCVNWPAARYGNRPDAHKHIITIFSEGEPFDANVFSLVENTIDFIKASVKTVEIIEPESPQQNEN